MKLAAKRKRWPGRMARPSLRFGTFATCVGARVAPQQSPILRTGKERYAETWESQEHVCRSSAKPRGVWGAELPGSINPALRIHAATMLNLIARFVVQGKVGVLQGVSDLQSHLADQLANQACTRSIPL